MTNIVENKTFEEKMSDRELLEAAAKAAGIYLEWDGNPDEWQPTYYECKIYYLWNPLTDDGDCARLEAELGICIEWWSDSVCCTVDSGASWTELFADHKDKNAARRYASTALAAEIGRTM